MFTPLTLSELEAGLETIRQSPQTDGSVIMIVERPTTDLREVVEVGYLDLVEGLIGDSWKTRNGDSKNRDTQLTLINARLLSLVARTKDRWPLAGDQLVVDLDLSVDNLPAGTRLAIGQAVIEVTAQPHTGCNKFTERYGIEAMKWVNSPVGKQLRLRGLNAKVIRPGTVQLGDIVEKLESTEIE